MAIGAGAIGPFGHWLSNVRLSVVGSAGMAVALIGLWVLSEQLWWAVG
ncbi:MAG: hypothetical protein SXA11_11120 [Cyanobacteriota bacterium]|nr:hypothetical protein [Cyanobacteriota bacterium]